MTTINKNGMELPLDVALKRAREAYIAGKGLDGRKATSAQLEKRQKEILEYRTLSQIAKEYGSRVEYATMGHFNA